ncbi:MAG: hypothetical protein D6790_06745, partial [Caldilineae bacterium]
PMPELAYLSGAGYPLVRDGACLLATHSDGAVGAVWSVLARIAQAGRRLADFVFVDPALEEGRARPLLVMGAREDIPSVWWQGTPLASNNLDRPDLEATRLAIRSRQVDLVAQYVRDGRTVTLFSAADGAHIEEAAWRLTDYPVWNAMKGDGWMWAIDADQDDSGHALRLMTGVAGGSEERP